MCSPCRPPTVLATSRHPPLPCCLHQSPPLSRAAPSPNYSSAARPPPLSFFPSFGETHFKLHQADQAAGSTWHPQYPPLAGLTPGKLPHPFRYLHDCALKAHVKVSISFNPNLHWEPDEQDLPLVLFRFQPCLLSTSPIRRGSMQDSPVLAIIQVSTALQPPLLDPHSIMCLIIIREPR